MACWKCGGSGEFVYCIDDLCHGQEECIHGDPPGICDECHGVDRDEDDWPEDDTAPSEPAAGATSGSGESGR